MSRVLLTKSIINVISMTSEERKRLCAFTYRYSATVDFNNKHESCVRYCITDIVSTSGHIFILT